MSASGGHRRPSESRKAENRRIQVGELDGLGARAVLTRVHRLDTLEEDRDGIEQARSIPRAGLEAEGECLSIEREGLGVDRQCLPESAPALPVDEEDLSVHRSSRKVYEEGLSRTG